MRKLLVFTILMFSFCCNSQVYETSKLNDKRYRIGYTTDVATYSVHYNDIRVEEPKCIYKLYYRTSGSRDVVIKETYHTQKIKNDHRIKVYDDKGKEEETPGGDDDSLDWIYRRSGSTWWCSRDGGVTWYQWHNGLFGFGRGWWPDLLNFGDNPENSQKYHTKNPVPINDEIATLVTMLAAYFVYLALKNHEEN